MGRAFARAPRPRVPPRGPAPLAPLAPDTRPRARRSARSPGSARVARFCRVQAREPDTSGQLIPRPLTFRPLCMGFDRETHATRAKRAPGVGVGVGARADRTPALHELRFCRAGPVSRSRSCNSSRGSTSRPLCMVFERITHAKWAKRDLGGTHPRARGPFRASCPLPSGLGPRTRRKRVPHPHRRGRRTTSPRPPDVMRPLHLRRAKLQQHGGAGQGAAGRGAGLSAPRRGGAGRGCGRRRGSGR